MPIKNENDQRKLTKLTKENTKRNSYFLNNTTAAVPTTNSIQFNSLLLMCRVNSKTPFTETAQ
jgi:hypothetical protein